MSRFKFWLLIRLNKWFQSQEPTLYVIKGYAYLEVGTWRLYFHNTKDRVVRKRVVDTFSGKKTQYIIPYDGWEKSL